MNKEQVHIGFSGRRLLEILGEMYPSHVVDAIAERATQTALEEGRDWIGHRSVILAAAELVGCKRVR